MPSTTAPNTVEIKIKGQVDPSLAASAAIAKAQFNDLKAETDALATQMVAAGATGDAALVSTLQKVAGEAQTAGNTYKSIMKEMGQATHGLGTSQATYEFTALFDELSSGRARRAPATLALIGQRVLGLNGSTLLAIGGVVAIGAAIAALVYDSLAASEAIGRLSLTAKALGNDETYTSLEKLRNTLADLPGVSRDASIAIINAVQNMGVTARPAIEGLALAANQYALAYGVKAVDATKTFQKILEGQHVTTASVLEDFRGLTAAQAQHIAEVARGNNINATAATIMDVVAQNTKNLGNAFQQSTSQLTKGWSNLLLWGSVLEQQRGIEETFDVTHTKTTKLWDDQTAAILRNAAALATDKSAGESSLDAAIRLSSNSTHAQVTQLKADIKVLQAELADPKATEDEKANFRSMIQDNERQLQALQNRSFKGTGFSNVGAQAIAQAREAVSEINLNQKLGDQERLAEIEKTYNDILASGKLNAAQRLSVETELNRAVTAEERKAEHDQEQITQSTERTKVQLARVSYEELKSSLDAEVAAHRLTKQQELQDLIAQLNQIETLQLKAVDDSVKGYDKDSVEYARAQNEKLLITARTAQQIKQLRAELAAQQAKDQNTMLRSVEQTENQIVRGLLTGSQTITSLMVSAAERVAEAWIGSELKTLTEHINTELQKTLATEAGAKQRLAAEQGASTQASGLGIISAEKQIYTEAAKAAAATYATVAEIPVVGPFLAPEAAAAAFVAVEAFGNFASAEGGQWQVPFDGQLTQLHKNEMVLPAWAANPLRSMVTDQPQGGQRGLGGGAVIHQHTYNINAVDAASFAELVKRNPEAIAYTVSRHWNKNAQSRPTY